MLIDVLGFQKNILAFLGSMTVLATFPQIGRIYFQSFGHTANCLNVDQIYDEDGAVSSGTLEELVPMLDHSFSSSSSFGQNKLERLS